jgi:uncharacterized circularly permuted ATP-grasp superfamily protein/uncharacterized alpha-E superfamily protein
MQPDVRNGSGGEVLAGYRPQPGIADELMTAGGSIRPVWKTFIDHFARLDREEIERRFARGDQYLRDAGVYFRQRDETGSSERDWPLSHVPILIHEQEWTHIAQGLIQRADLLEAVAADLYGDNRLVAEGHLPAALIAQSREWLRPLVGVLPRGGHYLSFVAFEIGRGPDGTWWVLGDRTQAPSGAGFALENRIATARAFSDLYAEAHVHRLAGFFRQFRDAVNGMREHAESRAAILTPGPLNETYFEHAYIARYLGFMLLEGEDLTVRDGKLMVRTVAGLHPVDVLWRRLDATFADPLALDETSRLGTPGLVSALRAGSTTMINALGSGVLEMRALLAFLPRISEVLRSEPLRLPNVATWWCGQPAERALVKAQLGRMMISEAMSTRLPFELDEFAAVGGELRGAHSGSLEALIDAEGPRLVGQEVVTLSTTPAWRDGRLQPRPMSLRIFLARTPAGWQVMPGGYARIGQSQDSTAIAMHRGGSVADVWIVSDAAVEQETMLPAADTPFLRAPQGVLPSRAADNLYWLGRYIERAEGYMRLIRAYHQRLAEMPERSNPLLSEIEAHLAASGIDITEELPKGLTDTLAAAVNSASKIRDRFSVDGWLALNDLAGTMQVLRPKIRAGDDTARAMSILLRKISGFTGLVHENMYRFVGWRFMSIGRALERGIAMAAGLAQFADPEAPDGALDLTVEIGDSSMSHRRRYAVTTSRTTVVDLLALDGMNPRSLHFSASEIRTHVDFLPGASVHGQLSPLARAVLETETTIAIETPMTLDTEKLLAIRTRLMDISSHLSDAYFS